MAYPSIAPLPILPRSRRICEDLVENYFYRKKRICDNITVGIQIMAGLNNAVVWIISNSFFDFQLFQSPFQAFRERSKCANNKWYHRHPYVAQLA